MRILEAAGALGVVLGGIVAFVSAWAAVACVTYQSWALLFALALPNLVAGFVAGRCGLRLIRERRALAAAVLSGLTAIWALESTVGLASALYHSVLWRGGGHDVAVLWALWIGLCATCSLLSLLSLPLCWRAGRGFEGGST